MNAAVVNVGGGDCDSFLSPPVFELIMNVCIIYINILKFGEIRCVDVELNLFCTFFFSSVSQLANLSF